MLPPLVGMAAINAILFGVQGSMMKLVQPQGGLPKIKNSFLAGSVAGAVQCVVCCPMELVKLRLQIQEDPVTTNNLYSRSGIKKLASSSLLSSTAHKGGAHTPAAVATASPATATTRKIYNGPLDCTMKILRQKGISGLYKGGVVTFLRETPAFGSYFACYDFLCQAQIPTETGSMDDVSMVALSFAGGVSGILAWLVTYPCDVVKSRLQIDGVEGPPIYKNTMDAFIKSYRESGFRVFFKGLNSTIIRAIPVNAVTLPTVTLILRYWQ